MDGELVTDLIVGVNFLEPDDTTDLALVTERILDEDGDRLIEGGIGRATTGSGECTLDDDAVVVVVVDDTAGILPNFFKRCSTDLCFFSTPRVRGASSKNSSGSSSKSE